METDSRSKGDIMGRTHYLKRRLLQGVFATVLACGLVVPAVGLTAQAEEPQPTAPIVAPQDVEATVGETPTDDAAVQPDATAPMTTMDTTEATADDLSALAAPEAVEGETALLAETAPGTPVTVGNFVITGGVQGTDYRLDGKVLHIMGSAPMTIANVNPAAAHDTTIDIDAGVQADLTLAGVNISSAVRSPINMITNSDEDHNGVKVTNANQIVNKTTLHLTLADGSTNNLTCSNQGTTGSPAIRCGWGSILIIDDGVTNIRAGGSKFNLNDIVSLDGGMVAEETTLLDGTALSVGDPLIKLESANPGKLNAQGGGHSAGIGSAANENAGTLVFNGGTIVSRACPLSAGWGNANGAGIGSGSGGSGTVMIFNGGNINAYASSCGAGIGSALGYFSSDHINGVPKGDAINIPNGEAASGGYSFIARPDSVSWFCCKTTKMTCPNGVHYIQGADANNYFTVAGDITVNGGLIYAHSGRHGNAFGQSCAHGPSSNRNHVVRITGGTLLTQTKDITSTDPPRAALGAAYGYTIVTGGSVQLETKNGKPAFQGIGDTAYNTQGIASWADVTAMGGSLPDKDKVQMLTIDLSSEFAEGANKTVPVTSWKLEVDGQVQNYGAPSYLYNGKLSLWLPADATGKNVTVTMSYRDNEGNIQKIEPLYVEEVGGPQGSTLKRYIDIEVDKLTPEQAAYFSDLQKDYDGLPLPGLTVSAQSPIDTTPFEAQGKLLDDPSKIETRYQLHDKIGGSPLPGAGIITGSSMPADTGVYKFELVSKQYAEKDGFKENYWGHRITGWCAIKPVPAVLTLADNGIQWGHLADNGTWTPITDSDDTTEAGNRIRLQFDVRSANSTALSCDYPTGAVQVTIDGVPVGDPIPLTKENIEKSAHSSYAQVECYVEGATADKTGNRKTVKVTYYLDPTQSDAAFAQLTNPVTSGKDGAHVVNLEYIADKNYIQGVDDNPENADSGATIIVPVDPGEDVEIKGPSGLTPDPEWTEIPDPAPDGVYDPTKPVVPDPDDPAWDTDTRVKHKSVSGTYSAFHNGNVSTADFFSMKLVSSSAMPVTYTSSNPAVADIVRDEDGNPVFNDDGTVKVQVNSCGTAVIIMEQKANTLYNGTKNVLTVNITPDPSITPEVQVRVLARNVTPGKAADAPLCPGDTVEYILTGLNKTAGSVWKNASLTDGLDPRLVIDPSSVRMTMNYSSPAPAEGVSLADHYAQLSPAFYKGFDWDSATLGWSGLTQGSATADGQFGLSATTLSKMVGDIYGSQSRSVAFRATVPTGLVSRPTDTDPGPADVVDDPAGEGDWGNPTSQPGAPDTYTPLPPENIEIVDVHTPTSDPDGPGGTTPGTDPTDPTKPVPGTSLPIVPKDPVTDPDPDDPDAKTDITVEKTVKNRSKGGRTAAPGDRLRYEITVSNHGTDSVWYSPVIRDTLPTGVSYIPGSMRLVRVDGTEMELDDGAYVESTRTVALYVDDLYCDESTTLVFECRVNSNANASNTRNIAYAFGTTPSEKAKEDPTPGPGTGDPENPGDTPGTPSDPEKPTPSTPQPGDPYVPTVKPGDPDDPDGPGTTPVDPDDPWKDWDWDDPDLPVPPGPAPTDPVSPGKITKPDAVEDELCVRVDAQNLNRALDATMVGDTLAYTVTFENHGTKGQLQESVLRFQLPAGVTLVPGSMAVTVGAAAEDHDGLAAGTAGEERTLAPEEISYDATTGLIAVHTADLDAGRQVKLFFRVTVEPEAAGTSLDSSGFGVGTLPSRFSGTTTEAGVAFRPAEGQLAYVTAPGRITLEAPHSLTVSPVTDPKAGDITVEKTAQSSGGESVVHTGDTITYTITVANHGEGTWRNAAVTDKLPEGLSLDVASLSLTGPDGKVIAVDGAAWHGGSRTLSVALGDLGPGETYVLTFTTTVEESAAGRDIGNVAVAKGFLPSDVDGTPDGEALPEEEPGGAHGDPVLPEGTVPGEVAVEAPVYAAADPAVYRPGEAPGDVPQGSIPGGNGQGGTGQGGTGTGNGGTGADGQGGTHRLPWTGGTIDPAVWAILHGFVPGGLLLPVTGDPVSTVPLVATMISSAAALGAVWVIRRRH